MNIVNSIIYKLLMIRVYAFKIYGTITLLLCCIVMNTVGLLGASLKTRLFICWIWSSLYRLGVLLILQIYVKVDGKENIKAEPCIYISKHQSMLETFMFYSLVGKCCFVMKQELLDKPVFGLTNKFAEAIPVDRNKGLSSLRKVIQEGKDRVFNKKMSIIVFPEGTRVAVGDYPKFHRSAMKLATDTGVPVIPVSHNFGVYFGRKAGDFIKPGIARMSFGEAIDPNQYTTADLTKKCYDSINAKTKELGG